jgi:hypothetical protein
MDQTLPPNSVTDPSTLEKLKIYAVEVIINKLGPGIIGSALTALIALATTHAGVLESWGITFHTWPFVWAPGQEPSGPCMLIEFDTISKTALVTLSAFVTGAMALGWHHAWSALTGKPQSGGQRATDQ